MTPPPMNVPDWMLERYALGELPPDQSEAIRARLQAEAEAVRAGLTLQGDLSARLEALQASDDAILEAHPPRQAAAEIRRRLHRRRAEDDQAARLNTRQRRWLAGLVPAVIAAVMLFLVLPQEPSDYAGLDPDGEIIQTTRKGPEQPPELQVWRETGSDEEQLGQGAQARQADLIQLAYVTDSHQHGVILSLDGRGAVTLHHPAEPGGSTQLSLDGRTPLGFSYELDDAPRFERFFLVSSDKPIDVRTVLDAADRLANSDAADSAELPLPQHLSQTDVRLVKVDR
jgi:hypothetical protein